MSGFPRIALLIGAGAAAASAAAALTLWPGVEHRRRRAEEDVEMLQRAIASMALDFCGGGRPAYIETGCTDGSKPIYAFRMTWGPGDLDPPYSGAGVDNIRGTMLDRRCLTTPVAYAQSYSADPFTGEGYGYWPAIAEEVVRPAWWDGSTQGAYVITSAGPDGRHEIDQRALCLACLWGTDGRIVAAPALDVPVSMERVSPEFFNQLYDPTNGLRSAGDIAWLCGHYGAWEINRQCAPGAAQ